MCVQSQDDPLEGAREELEQSCACFSFVTVSGFWGPSALAAGGTLLALNRGGEDTLSLRYPRRQTFVICTTQSFSNVKTSEKLRAFCSSVCFWKQSRSSLSRLPFLDSSVKKAPVDFRLCVRCFHESA